MDWSIDNLRQVHQYSHQVNPPHSHLMILHLSLVLNPHFSHPRGLQCSLLNNLLRNPQYCPRPIPLVSACSWFYINLLSFVVFKLSIGFTWLVSSVLISPCFLFFFHSFLRTILIFIRATNGAAFGTAIITAIITAYKSTFRATFQAALSSAFLPTINEALVAAVFAAVN